MSLQSFIIYLQELLTMVDPKDSQSITIAFRALTATEELARRSRKADGMTCRIMGRAIDHFEELVQTSADFAGVPGDTISNTQKRRRLLMTLRAGC